jgi:hypothetical protein
MNSSSSNASREKTLRLIINGLVSRPSFLLLFGMGVMASAVVLGTFCLADPKLVTFAVGSWFIYLLICAAVAYVSEKGRKSGLSHPDETAMEAFEGGPDAGFLAGHWTANWKTNERPDDKERIDGLVIMTSGSKIFVSMEDTEICRTYWMLGRLSEEHLLSMVYWHDKEKGFSQMCGNVLLMVDDSFGGKGRIMTGTWKGMGKDGTVAHGDTVWKKVG